VYHGLRYRFEVLISELKTAESDVLRSTLLAFVNCLVFGCEDLHQRDRIRNEFLGLGLGGVLSELRNSESELVQIQVEVFDEKLHRDQSELEKDPRSLSPQQLFDIISNKIADSPQALHFHSMLLNLSQLDTSQPATDHIWEALEEISAEDSSANKGSMRGVRNFVATKTFRSESTQTPARGWVRGQLLRPASVEIAVQVDGSDSLYQNTDVKTKVNICPVQEIESSIPRPPEKDLRPLQSSSPNTSETCTWSPQSPVSETALLSESHSIPASDIAATTSLSLQTAETMSSPPHLPVSGVLSLSPAQSLSPQCDISDLLSCSSLLENPHSPEIIPDLPPRNLSLTASDSPSSQSTEISVPPLPPLPPVMSSPPHPPPLPPEMSGPPPPPLPMVVSGPPPPPLPPVMSGPPPPPLPSAMSGPPPPPLPSAMSGPPPPPLPSAMSGPPPPPLPSAMSGPPPPPLPSAMSGPPPPTPLPSVMSGPPPPPLPMVMSGPPPFLPFSVSSQSSGYMTMPNIRSSLPCDLTDSDSWSPDNKFNTWHGSRRKMKTINWTKIPKTLTGDCVWTGVETLPKPERLDLQQLEELFCQKSGDSSKRPVSAPVARPISVELNLLDSKRSLAVNICLRQIKGRGSAVVKAVQDASSRELGTEKLRGLQRLLPDRHELELLSAHANEAERFGEAEKYFYELSKVPGYGLRVEAMLQREEFPTRLEELRPQLRGLVNMCDQLIKDTSLREFLTLVLQIGNCLNAGSYAGSAAGFKLNTLPKLLDTRANKPRMTFLHFVVQVAERNNRDALVFIKDLSNINDICKISVDGVEDEVRNLVTDIFKEFMEQALVEVDRLQQGVREVKAAAARLARHFCEDPDKFKLEECFRLFSDFFRRAEEVRKENVQRQKQEERAAQRTVRANVGGGKKKSSLKSANSEVCLVDRLMEEIRSGTFKLRRSEG
ncbi:formin-like protein 5, partial [Zootermopsis nevadensis]|uniref:formin-like protein 5 n=1 Tax=Zootermopsis nevadensis TaxID=136037 RepID=UPI000B8E8196